jgi:peptide-methionine (S)-S-oxide reductase
MVEMIRTAAGSCLLFMSFLGACGPPGGAKHDFPEPDPAALALAEPGTEHRSLVLAGGCFWCTEAVFEQLAGVEEVVSGYAGGSAATADYRSVSSGSTDHAESIRITYDPARISYGQLLEVFFLAAHDPTQLDFQWPDHGRQYRSTIFYRDDAQKEVAQDYIRRLDEAGVFDRPVVTTLEPLETFYPAEDYHQDYVRLNPVDGYVRTYARPKLKKVRKLFPRLVSR